MKGQTRRAHGGDTEGREGAHMSLRTRRGRPWLQDGLTCAQASELESLGRGDVGGDGAAGDVKKNFLGKLFGSMSKAFKMCLP